MMLLKDRVAVVTGGTRGIGYAIVKKYLENGAKVVLFGSKEESVNKAVQSLKAENPDWVVEGMWPNLTDSEEMEQAIAKVGEKYGRLDILVNNAGVSQSTKLEDYQPEDFAGIMNLNVNALFNAIQPAVKIMRAGRRRYPQHQLDGQHLRSAIRCRLSNQQICRQRYDPVAGKRAGSKQHPCQRRCTGCYPH